MFNEEQELDRTGEAIVLIHGIGAKPWVMRVMVGRLREYGYRVESFGYRTVLNSIPEIGKSFREYLLAINDDPKVERLHIVSHSMGGIISRQALIDGLPSKMGRLVMLAPPNRGSNVANYTSGFMRHVWPQVKELEARPDSFVNRLGIPLGVDIGIVAAEYDHLVPMENTRLDQQADHISVPALHSSLLFQRQVVPQVVSFLDSGKFARVEVVE